MTTILERLRTKLVADPDVTALVGVRVHALVVPQELGNDDVRFPAVVLTMVSSDPLNTQDRGSISTMLVKTWVQADSYASSYLEAHALAAAVDLVVAALADPQDIAALRIGAADGYEDETQLYRVSADYSVFAM